MENQIENSNQHTIEKKLKRSRYDFFDSGYACVCFIVLQVLVTFFVQLFREPIINSQWLYYLAQVLVESVFIFASLIVSSSRNVEFVKASTYNKKFDYKTALLAVVVSVICIFGFSSLTNVFVYSLEKLGYTSQVGSVEITNFGTYIIYVIVMCVVPAVFEETLFRSTILSGLRERGKTFAIVVSALVFMLMHGGPDQTIHQFILGVVLGYVFVYSGSIWVTVLIHFLNNFYAVTAIYLMSFVSSTEEVVETQLPSWGSLALNLVIGFAVACISAYLIYLCVKAMKNIKEQNQKKEKEKFLQLLDKGDLTEQEVAWLKKYNAQVDEYEEADKQDKSNEPESQILFTEQPGNLESTTIWVQESDRKKSSLAGNLMLWGSVAYLAIEWLLTLISGFMS